MTEDEFEEQGIYLRLRVRAEQTAESAKMAIMAENRMMVEIAVSVETLCMHNTSRYDTPIVWIVHIP